VVTVLSVVIGLWSPSGSG